MCLNEFLNVIFENVDVDNKMYLTCDQYEPIYSAKKAFSSCVIALTKITKCTIFLDAIFENVGVDNKMYLTCDRYEPIYSS